MRYRNKILFLGLAMILAFSCAEKSPEFPWITDLNTEVETSGKLVGYEFWAKW